MLAQYKRKIIFREGVAADDRSFAPPKGGPLSDTPVLA
jgi:hypothetical protein